MVVLDIAIVNVALPSIQKDLGIGQSTVQWIVIAYGLMLGGFLLLGGRREVKAEPSTYFSPLRGRSRAQVRQVLTEARG
jgi:MFS family permease